MDNIFLQNNLKKNSDKYYVNYNSKSSNQIDYDVGRNYKYLYQKYKNKYLKLKIQKAGMERTNSEKIRVTLQTDYEELEIIVKRTDTILETLLEKTGYNKEDYERGKIHINFGGDPVVDDNASFADYGVEDGARISIQNLKPSFNDIVIKLAQVNGLEPDSLLVWPRTGEPRVTRNDDGSVHSWDLTLTGIRQLPDIFGELVLTGDLILNQTNIEEIPTSIRGLKVGGDFSLKFNDNLTKIINLRGIEVDGNIQLYNRDNIRDTHSLAQANRNLRINIQ